MYMAYHSDAHCMYDDPMYGDFMYTHGDYRDSVGYCSRLMETYLDQETMDNIPNGCIYVHRQKPIQLQAIMEH